ncbi:ABC transporter permease [Aquincola sp. S2]|uniref:ABC transporter permease n=1 Tax=Pseudaquabacterium terrae TaxID=2732868 RepID=A0ABX2EIE3_9BURK|nr:ABC transporter permease [Aquabacterium terrae]NRF68365.1 ABC transporter permease [Aquabacterium terrae]
MPRAALFAHRASAPFTRWFAGWWRVVQFSTLMLTLAASPASYRGGEQRRALAQHLVAGTSAALAWFTLVAALATLVITRIVLVTAISYGLSRYALEMLIRVLVLELIPLAAAFFVAVRFALPAGTEIVALRRSGRFAALQAAGRDPLRHELLPRALAGVFAVWMLAAASGVTALVLAYLVAHGFSPWGLAGYSRTVGHVLSPTVALVFVLKTLLFSLAVALMPLASAMADAPARRTRAGPELRGLIRMLAVMVLIELGSLMVNYY